MEMTYRFRYKFRNHNSLLFITGVPFCGKSTIASVIASLIKDCVYQSMDIIRLIAQLLEKTKAKNIRNRFVELGCCEGYTLIDDGAYSPNNLIKGYHIYSKSLFSIIKYIISKLEFQGVENVLFEGVQLMPSLVSQYLDNKNKLIVITSDTQNLIKNREKRFGKDKELIEKYSIDKLLLLQKEILRQSEKIPRHKLFIIENQGNYENTVYQILQFLQKTDVITPFSLYDKMLIGKA
jgi:2-phosphoglycerate kinase